MIGGEGERFREGEIKGEGRGRGSESGEEEGRGVQRVEREDSGGRGEKGRLETREGAGWRGWVREGGRGERVE